MNNWKPILAALVIFAAGFVTGGLAFPGGQRTVMSRAEPSRENGDRELRPERSRDGHLRDLCGKLQEELSLTPIQRQRIEEIVRVAHERVKVVADNMGPRINAEFKQMEADILKELTPDQAERFKTIIRERESRFGRGKPAIPSPQEDPSPPPHLPPPHE